MKSQIKLAKEDATEFTERLVKNGCQINLERIDWRVLMFRKKKQASGRKPTTD